MFNFIKDIYFQNDVIINNEYNMVPDLTVSREINVIIV